MKVFVVRTLFEDCNENDTLGVYTDFLKAIAAVKEHADEENPGSGYSFAHSPDTSSATLWCEVLYNGDATGIYYTIEKMELE